MKLFEHTFVATSRVYEVVKVHTRTMVKGFTRLRAGSRVYFEIKLKGGFTTRGMKYSPTIEMYDAYSHTLLCETTFNMLGRMVNENIEFREV